MYQPRKLRLTASIILFLACVLQAQGADKYTDENRPYEFGFKIDGQQHRHESKDKDGIIMGEFGFITADDVYHVTVYATDKEGRFKILSMKNIHLKSSPGSSTGSPTSARQGHALALPPAQGTSVQAPVVHQGAPAPQPGKTSQTISIEKPGKSCSSCSIPTTTTRAPPPAYNQVNGNNNYNSPNQFGAPGPSLQNQQVFPPSSLGQQNYPPQGQNVSQNYPQKGPEALDGAAAFVKQPGQTAQTYPGSPSYSQGLSAPKAYNNYAQPGSLSSGGQNQGGAGRQTGTPKVYPGEQNSLTGGGRRSYGETGPIGPAGFGGGPSGPGASFYPQGEAGGRTSKQYNGPAGPDGPAGFESGPGGPGASSYPQGEAGGSTLTQYNSPEQQYVSNVGPNGSQGPGFAPAKPTLVSAQMQIVDKNTDVYALRPSETAGLPPGLNKDDITQLLYTFNYTVGFHGHFEEGYTNGVKKGYYYVTGRNGVRTRIDYVADDSGFHPKVSQDVLDLLSDDVPKPETEKDAKFGLKGYEFKWLYYPVDSKRR